MASDELHTLRGPTDRAALIDFWNTFERVEPLASGELDDFVNPRELSVSLDDGVGDAAHARLDVEWTVENDYNIHYTDASGRNLRWDVHPHSYPQPVNDGHFHPPPDASNEPSDVERSCIDVREVELVAQAVHSLWRNAYEHETLDGINTTDNPP